MIRHFPIFAFFSVLIWSGNFIAVKAASLQSNIFLLATLRIGLISVCVLPFFPKPPLPLKKIVMVALIFIPQMILMMAGLSLDFPASIGAVVYQLSIPIIMVCGIFLYKERPSPLNFLGVAVAIVAMYMLYGSPNLNADPLGYFVFVICALMWVVYTMYLKSLPKVSPIALMVWINVISLPFVAGYLFWSQPDSVGQLFQLDVSFWIALLYMSFMSSFIAHSCWVKELTRTPAYKVAPLTLLVPLLSALLEGLIFGEFLHREALLYMVFILIGVGLSEIRRVPVTQETKA